MTIAAIIPRTKATTFLTSMGKTTPNIHSIRKTAMSCCEVSNNIFAFAALEVEGDIYASTRQFRSNQYGVVNCDGCSPVNLDCSRIENERHRKECDTRGKCAYLESIVHANYGHVRTSSVLAIRTS